MQKCIFLNIWFCLWMILPFLQLAANVHSEDRLFAEGLWDDARIGYESSTPFTSVSPPFLSKSDLLRRQICLAACCLEEDDPTRCLQALPYSRRSFWGPSFYLYVKALRQSGQTKQALQTLLFSSSKQITSSPLLLHAFAGEVYLACAKLFTPSLERLKQTISSAKSFLKRGKPRLFTPPPLSNPYLFYVWGMQEPYHLWEQLFSPLLRQFSDTEIAPTLLFSLAAASTKTNAHGQAHLYLQELLTKYPSSPLAPYAYLQQYPLKIYASGEKKALAHLSRMERLFPKTPLLLPAHYLIALASLRDQYSEKGRLLKSRNLLQAIASFQKIEMLFDAFVAEDLIPQEQLPYFSFLRFRAWLDRSLANTSIAESSSGTKKIIYLRYALQSFQELLQALPLQQDLSPLREEALFYLAKSYLSHKQHQDSAKTLVSLLSTSPDNSLWRRRGLVLQAVLLKEELRYKEALQSLNAAEMHSLCFGFSQEEQLQLWIEKSLCLREMGEYGESMKWLSRVINEEAASQKRIEAMLLRADLYRLEGRKALALRQLEAVMQRGGLWGKQAKEAWDAIQSSH